MLKQRPFMQYLLCICACVIAIGGIFPSLAFAEEPFRSYTYSHRLDPMPSPNPYRTHMAISGGTLGINAFRSPQDVAVSSDGKVYILDSGNSRIVILDSNYEYIGEIAGFDNNGKEDAFKNPHGLYITEKGHIYVADTDNKRLVELDPNGKFLNEWGTPQSEILPRGFNYLPTKVAVDRADRKYVISRGVFDGIIELDANGDFYSFMGAPRVRANLIDFFWKRIATDAQRERMLLSIPTEFNSLDMDENGFIFTTTQTESNAPIQLLNPGGVNILKSSGYARPIGDLKFIDSDANDDGPSAFVDVASAGYGIYSVLDSKRGRIFTYNEEGRLMYIFGALGKQIGTFRSPVAIEYLGEDILVLDRDFHTLTVFRPTPFGQSVNQANISQYLGKENDAKEAWQEVLKYDANYETAYVGIGKALYHNGDYKEAMRNFKLGHDRQYYSKAFEKYRKELSRKYFAPFMTTIFILALAYFSYRIVRRRLRKTSRNGGVESHVS